MAIKPSISNRTSGNLASNEIGPESFQNRNDVIPNPDKMRRELLAVLGYYKKFQDVDASPLEIGQTNSQKDVMANVAEAAVKGDYPTAQAILFREDLIMTPELEEIALRLNRLVQVDVRSGTTDSLEFTQAKKSLKDHEEELAGYFKHGGKDEALLVLENVSESISGTREMGQEELLEVREMVQLALKAEFKSNYEPPLAPHQLAGQKEGSKFINRSENPKLTEFLRLFDSITLELKRQREISSDKDRKLTLEREITMNFLSGLPNLPGIDFNDNLRKQFLKKVAVMDLNQLMYFDQKVEQLERGMGDGAVSKDEANSEIRGWLSKEFTPEELHQEIEELKNRDEQDRAAQLKVLRGDLKATPITKPLHRPVSQSEYEDKAA